MDRDEVVSAHYQKNFKGLVKYMSRRTPNQSVHLAEEVVQEAYTKALTHWKAFNPERGAFNTWFNRILNNSLNNCLSSESGNLPSFDDDDLDLEPFIIDNDPDIPRNIVVRIQKSISEQKPEHADVLHMFFNLGMRTRQIEECSEFSHDNIRKIIQRFRIKWDDENIY